MGFIEFLKNSEDTHEWQQIYLAGDLRESTPRIMRAVNRAISDSGFKTISCGLIPTPALANFSLKNQVPSIMVTGSHIPADRNGIKFYKSVGEILKSDEAGIQAAVAKVRADVYSVNSTKSMFDQSGCLKDEESIPDAVSRATELYRDRYINLFGAKPLEGKSIIFYQHSAVGRDILANLLEELGADVVREGRSDEFVSIDTENVTLGDRTYFRSLAMKYPENFAIISTDGDSDRPFVVDEDGIFHRGDELGAITAKWLNVDFAAIPVSSSDAVDTYLEENGIAYTHTRIGSPYVISEMIRAIESGKERVVGWEVNGGFLVGSRLSVNSQMIEPLPTRDAFLPIVIALISAIEANKSVSAIFKQLPSRFTQAGIIDNFPQESSRSIVEKLSSDLTVVKAILSRYLNSKNGFDTIKSINTLDGVRVYFDNSDIIHIRPSGNAPQLRVYSVASTQARADEIVQFATDEKTRLLYKLANEVS